MTVTIERLGHLGEGIADGPVYVPRTLPGEVIAGDIADGRITKPKIMTPSVHRVSPACRHYATCGGCSLLHADDGFVSDWKRAVVQTALAAQGLKGDVLTPVTSPPGSRRRATLTGRRLKSGPVVGFHGPASDVVTAIPDCRLLLPDLLAAIPACEDITVRFGSRKGSLRFQMTASDAGVDIDVAGMQDADGPAQITLSDLANRHDLARLSISGEVLVERRAPLQRFGDAKIVPPSGAFLQATKHGEQALTQGVLTGLEDADCVVDLFAGCGTFTLPIAAQAETLAVEAEASMLEVLDRGWRQSTGLKRVKTETRDLFRRPLEPDEFKSFDAAVIDPPRAGAEAQMHALAASDIEKIVAVSCNPVSFARDAKILSEAGFRMNPVQVVDQFRWSPHLELVATFTRTHIRKRP